MKEYFEKFMNQYLNVKSRKTDSSEEYFKLINKTIPNIIYNIIKKDNYKVKGSCGIGNKADVPWVGLFNKKITKEATYGIYIVYLFKKDMTGFYLSLNQGLATFKKNYGSNSYKNASKVADYFRKTIDTKHFSNDQIFLTDKNNSLGNGYQKTNVISKYYEFGKFTDEEILFDLKELINIYDEVVDNMDNLSYDEIVHNVINNTEIDLLISIEADKLLEKALIGISKKRELTLVNLTENKIYNKNINKFSEMTIKKTKKVNYVDKLIKSSEIGLLGEKLVMEYERQKLILQGKEKLSEQIRWVSDSDDSLGYDILSYEKNQFGQYEEIFIEVKTTESNVDNVFFISKNEISKIDILKSKYWIYRIYDIKSNDPKFYRINGLDFNSKFDLIPQNYIAAFKN